MNDYKFEYDPDTEGMALVKCSIDTECVVIPCVYDGKPVTVIGSYCFVDVIDKSTQDKDIFVPKQDNTALKKVILPNTLLEIRYCAFMHCTALEEVVIPENVQYIGPSSFLNCHSLRTIKFPCRCRMVLRGVCRNCYSLEKADISGAFEIEYGAFSGCRSLSDVSIGKRLRKIGAMAFMDCNSLEDIKLPESLNEVEQKAFWNTEIKSLVLPKSVYRKGESLFNT